MTSLIIHVLYKNILSAEYESNIIDAEQVQNLKCTYAIKNLEGSSFEKNNEVEFLLSNGERINIPATGKTIFRIYDEGKEIIKTDSQRLFEKAYILARSGLEVAVESQSR